ncbi:MAG: hypothetical protein MJK13_18490, partial [Pseudomonadales bacterium]|nr:hypothetical protein [Pseudomonadales bacterium]
MMTEGSDKKQQLLSAIIQKFGEQFITEQSGCGRVLTFWVAQTQLQQVLCYLRDGPDKYLMLVDLYAVDERLRQHTSDQPNCDFSIIYQL